MSSVGCHPSKSAAREGRRTPRDLIIGTLGLRRVSQWCDVSESAVSQWLRRGTPEAPVPARVVPRIAAGAAGEGIEFDLGILWPAMAGTPASRFKGPPEDLQ